MSGISASLSGVNVSAQNLAVTANNIANINTNGYKSLSLQQEAVQGGGVEAGPLQASQEPTVPGGSNVDLATQAVNLDTQGLGYQANLKVLQVQQTLVGTALDFNA